MKLGKIAFRNIRRNTRRSLLSMTAIAVAAMSMIVMFAFITGMKDNLAENLQTYMTGEIRIRHKEFDTYEHLHPIHLRIPSYRRVVQAVKNVEGVTAAAPRISVPGQVYLEDERYHLTGIAFDPALEREFQDIESRIVKGRLPSTGNNEAAVGMGVSERLGLNIGDTFTMLTQTMHRGTNAVTFTVTGIVNYPIDSLNTTTFYAPLDRMQYILQMDDAVTDILVKTDGKPQLGRTADGIKKAIGETGIDITQLSIQPWTEIPTSYQFIDMAGVIYNFMALFFFILGSTVIITTTMMVIYERMKEIGTIAALGMTGGEIVRLFFLEAFFLSLIGSGAGVLLGSIITLPFQFFGINFGSMLEGVSMEVSNVVYPTLRPQNMLYIFVFSVVVASAASFLPSRKAAKIEPVHALRTE